MRWLIVLFSVLSLGYTLDQPVPSRFLVEYDEQFRFYRIEENGSLELVGILPPQFRLTNSGEGEWKIPTAYDFALSPDNRQVAFVAYRSSEEIALFIHTFGETDLIQQPIEAVGGLEWSPTGDVLLITKSEIFYDLPFALYNDSYIYKIQEKTISEFIDEPELQEWLFEWLPDNQHVVFVGRDPSNGFANDLYLTDRSGSPPIRLTTLSDEIPALMFQNICALEWSPVDERIYYSVECTGSPDNTVELLYSTDLEGDNRQEIDFSSMYPDDIEGSIHDIQLSDNSIYVITGSVQIPELDPPRPELNYRIFQIVPPLNYKLLFELKSSPPSRYLEDSAFSPDKSKMILTTASLSSENNEGHILVIDLNTSELVLDQPVENLPCDIQWLNTTTILYSLFQRSCAPFDISPKNIRMLDITTGDTINVTEHLSHLVWLIPPY